MKLRRLFLKDIYEIKKTTLLEMKEAWKRKNYYSNVSTGFIVQEGALRKGTPEKQLELPATYLLGIDTGSGLKGKPC
jgi:hypothetical protein